MSNSGSDRQRRIAVPADGTEEEKRRKAHEAFGERMKGDPLHMLFSAMTQDIVDERITFAKACSFLEEKDIPEFKRFFECRKELFKPSGK